MAIGACCLASASARPAGPPHRVGYASQIFVVDRDGGARRLTSGHRGNYFPAWSPNTLRIATLRGSHVELLARDGHVTRRLWGGPRLFDPISWSPDGRRLAFVANYPRGDGFDARLVTVSLDGGRRRVLAHHAAGRPVWSPDGRTIYYPHESKAGGLGPDSVWSVPSRGGARRKLISDVDGFAGVSSDGDWLLFFRYGEVGIVRPDGSDERQLLGHVYGPAIGWAPHGRGVFVHGGAIKHGSYLHLVSTSGKIRQLGAKFHSAQMAWSPDGRRVAWVSRLISKHETQVRSSRPDGSDRRILARFTSKDSFTELPTLSWSPGSRRLIVEASRHSGD